VRPLKITKRIMQIEFQEYVVCGVISEVSGVATLMLTKEDGTVPPFVPGQYVNIFFPETRTSEGKAYSISSAPSESTLSITVRAIGEFSNRLCSMRPGDTVRASLPYGFFYPEADDSELVMLAAGIGIAPFRSMIRHIAKYTLSRRLALFHSVRTLSDAIFLEECTELRQKFPNFSLTHFVTRDAEVQNEYVIPHRIEPTDILSRVSDVSRAEFLICGSISFTRDMWRGLRKAGVNEEKLYTEAFFSH